MHPFHLLVRRRNETEPRRIDFSAESADHAFVWRAMRPMVRMSSSGMAARCLPDDESDANIWERHPVSHAAQEGSPAILCIVGLMIASQIAGRPEPGVPVAS